MKHITHIKTSIRLLLLLLAATLFYGCRSTKNIAYLQDVETLTDEQLQKSALQYDVTIKPNDLLRIIVSGAEDADTYFPFNLTTSVPYGENATQSTPTLQSYLVDSKGTINFPVLGKLYVVRLTTAQVKQLIVEKLTAYLKGNVVVTVRLASFRISVLGEVERPGLFTVTDEKISLLQALSMAGDLTIYGRRDVVKILREGPDGQKSITTLNLNNKNLIFSPYYYLRQGDVVYVEPNKARAKGAGVGTATNVVFSVVSVVIGVASLIVTIAR